MHRLLVNALLCLGIVGSSTVYSQQVAIDRGVRAAGLWCFPVETNPKQYVYLPATAGLATDDNGKPQFSFIRYVLNEPEEGAGAASITQAEGGGILHFLVTLETPQEQIEQAEAELKEELDDDEVKLRGPLVFKEGQYALISSVITESGGAMERHLLATGSAPVLEGNRLAFSFDLEPERATLLLRSLTMATPDVSLVFDMTFDGLTEAYDADLLIDWTEVRKHKGYAAGGSVYWLGADVKLMFDELRRNKSIQLVSRGTDATSERLLTTVYDKLLSLMFRPVESEKIPPEKKGGLADAIDAVIKLSGDSLSSRKTTGFGLNIGYQIKETKTTGTSFMSFNHRGSVERHNFITFNIGDIYQRFGENKNYFKAVNLGDPTFQQREIRVSLDGALLPEFERYINSVTLTLRKIHGSGKQTIREIVLDRKSAQQDPSQFRMVYGWEEDDDRMEWLKYDYRTRWSFKGGGSYQTDWVGTDSPMIDLFAPYERRTVQIYANREDLLSQGVRAVVVRIAYPFFKERRSEQLVIRPYREQEDLNMEITLPLGQYDYDYDVSWMLEGNRRLKSQGKDETGVLFVDELPSS